MESQSLWMVLFVALIGGSGGTGLILALVKAWQEYKRDKDTSKRQDRVEDRAERREGLEEARMTEAATIQYWRDLANGHQSEIERICRRMDGMETEITALRERLVAVRAQLIETGNELVQTKMALAQTQQELEVERSRSTQMAAQISVLSKERATFEAKCAELERKVSGYGKEATG